MIKIAIGDCRKILKDIHNESIDCCITSPPYWKIFDYKNEAQTGLEDTVDEYVTNLLHVFDEVQRILKDSGTLWVNIADVYFGNSFNNNGNKFYRDGQVKSLANIPGRFITGMQHHGWLLRNKIVWYKSNIKPHSYNNKFPVDSEDILFFSKSEDHYFNPLYEPALTKPSKTIKHRFPNGALRLTRSVWKIPIVHYKGFPCPYPETLVENCVLAGCPKFGLVLDPFLGSGTTAVVCDRLKRDCLGIELNPDFAQLAKERIIKCR